MGSGNGMSVVVAALLWAGGAAGQEAGDTIRGRVLDARTRTPVPGAVVTLTRGERPDTVGRALTGDDGRFALAAVSPGSYRLRVDAFGYAADASRTLDYRGGVLQIDVSVLPSPLAAGGIDVVVTRPAVVDEHTQVISGVILDAESEDPLADLSVSLRTVSDELLGWTTSDADGHFVFAVAEPGLYRLGFTAMGYDSTATAALAVARGQDVYVELRAEPSPFGLGQIRVTAAHDLPHLEAAGFYRRRELGPGDFYGPREVDRMPGMLTSQLLRQLADVTVVPWGMWIRTTGLPCAPTIVLDGLELRGIETRDRTLDQIVPERTIRAIEVYKHIHEIPQKWRGVAACAVIAIWTEGCRPPCRSTHLGACSHPPPPARLAPRRGPVGRPGGRPRTGEPDPVPGPPPGRWRAAGRPLPGDRSAPHGRRGPPLDQALRPAPGLDLAPEPRPPPRARRGAAGGDEGRHGRRRGRDAGRFRPLQIRGERVLGVAIDETGVQRVVVHRVERA